MLFRYGFLGLALAMLALTPAAGVDRHVAASGGTDTGDCSSQSAPCATIQYAVSVAVDGDTVRVRPGTYVECVNGAGIGLDFVADTATPGAVVVRHDDTCEPAMCSARLSLDCDRSAGCAGTCDTGGTDRCTNDSSVSCSSDAQCNFGTCITVRECPDFSRCLIDGDCTNNGFCAEIGYPVFELGDGSSLTGFELRNGRGGGVTLFGSGAITRNIIDGNDSGVFSGGGVYVLGSVGSDTTGLETRCWEDASIPCTADPGCSVCSNDASIVCQDNGDCTGGTCEIGVVGPCLPLVHVTIDENTIRNNTGDSGAGIATVIESLSGDAGVQVALTRNVIEGNTAGYSGGGLYALALYTGRKLVHVEQNTFTDNAAMYAGGGMRWSVRDAADDTEFVITRNVFDGNDAAVVGGGAYGYSTYGFGVESHRFVENTLTGNSADYGGGVYVTSLALYPELDSTIEITDNTIRANTARVAGGGGGAQLYAGYTGSERAAVEFRNNLIAGNTATQQFGGGLALLLRGWGGETEIEVDLNTIADNDSALGGAGIDITTDTQPGGEAIVRVTNTVFLDNDGAAIGGQDPSLSGTGTFSIPLDYNLFFGNTENWESVLASVLDPTSPMPNPNGLDENPLFDNAYVADLCSPTIDAAEPAAGFSEEPGPNGGRANLGHTGGTANATLSLADVDGDNAVDGKDILILSTAFGAASTSARYVAEADLDSSGLVDGDDLAYVTGPTFGQECLP